MEEYNTTLCYLVPDCSQKKAASGAADSKGITQKRSYIGGMEFLGNTQELVHHSAGYVRNKNAASDEVLILTGDADGNQQAKKITSTETVNMPAALAYKAAESISLQAGFEAKAGSDLHLTIELISTTPDYEWQYTISDHLGNTRVLFADKDGDGLIRQSDDEANELLGFYNYSAFGLELGGSHLNASNNLNRYTYNNKEAIGFSGYQDYGWRMFDRSIGRFTGVDPLAESMPSWSPYNYTFNNPIRFIDPNGLAPEPPVMLFSEGDINFENFNKVFENFQYEEGDNEFYVFGHGTSLFVIDDTGEESDWISSTEKFNEVMSEKSPAWKESMENNEDITCYLYSCNSATDLYTDDEGNELETTMFAQRLSEKYHNITVVGANGDVMYGTAEDGKPGIVGVNRPNDNIDGEFITFSKGKKVASRKANYTGEKTEYGPKKFFNHQ